MFPGWLKTLDADCERKEGPYLGKVLETVAPLALSAHLLDRCIVSLFVVPPCSQPSVQPGPYTSLWYHCLPCVEFIHSVMLLCLSIQCIAFDFTGGPLLSLFYPSPEFVLGTLPFRGAGAFIFIPLLLLPLPFTCVPCIIFPVPSVVFILLVLIECVFSSSRAGGLFPLRGEGARRQGAPIAGGASLRCASVCPGFGTFESGCSAWFFQARHAGYNLVCN